MRAVQYHKHGGPDILRVDETDKPKPKDNEVLVKIQAAGVNPVDTYFREGSYKPVQLPMIPGSDLAGKIETVGNSVNKFNVGDRVFGTGLGKDQQGTYAEYAVAPEDRIAKLPKNKDFEEGAAIALVGVTAWRALIDHANLKKSETCLIHGGSGGVGHAAVQIASSKDAEVITTAGSEDARQKIRELGADYVFDYNHSNLSDAIIKSIEEGPDVILDHRLNDYLQFDFDVANSDGRIVGIGESNNKVVLTNTPTARGKEITIYLMSMFNTPNMSEVLKKLADLMKGGDLTPEIAKRYKLDQAPEAQRTVMEESYVGKLVITP